MRRSVLPASVLFLADLCVASGSVYLAKIIQRYLPELSLPDEHLWIKAIVFAAVMLTSMYFQDLYNWKYWKNVSGLSSSILLGGGVALIVLALAYFIIPPVGLERDLLLMSLGSTLTIAFFLRWIYLKLMHTAYAGLRVVILGDGDNAKFLLTEIRGGGYPIFFEGYVGRNNWDLASRCLGDVDDLSSVIEKVDPDILVVAPDGWRGTLPVDDLLHIKLSTCDVIDGPTFYEQITGKLLVEELRPSSIIFTEGFMSSPFQDSLKRGFDLVLSLTGFIVTLPIMLITALAIRLDTPGPIFYLQPRVGKDGKDFKVIKFRSMYQDAEKNGPQWASENDPRVTRIGRIIRKVRIDELPQFINVIKNDMSFVGPRPERRFFVDQLEKIIPFYVLRMHAKPGITGWAQINFSYGDTIEDAKEKLKYELYYMKHRSLWLDLLIIFQTLKVALKGRGSQ